MMLFKRGFIILSLLCLIFLLVILEVEASSSNSNDKDPFRSLGIPDLNPKALLSEIDDESSKKDPNKASGKGAVLKTIDDLPNFLKNSSLNEEEGVKTLTRFLIQDDFTLKKYGVVYDQSGFDGLVSGERIAPIGTEDRLQQRARSTANIWFKEKFPKLEYDAYGAESIMDEIVPNWRIYKVLMIGKRGENTFLKVCLPLDESETALCSDKDELCGPRSDYVEKEKKKNEEYISKIRSNNFFKKKTGLGKIKLLPGEKMVAKQGDKKVVLDSNTLNAKNDGFYNPPSLDSSNGSDSLLNAFRMKNNNPGFMNNLPVMGMNNMNNINNMNMRMNLPSNYATTHTNQILPNINGFNPNFNLRGPQNSQGNFQNQPQPQVEGTNGYNFKQRDTAQTSQTTQNTQIHTPKEQSAAQFGQTTGNLMNELMNMKTQLSQMMASIKEKDEIINQQNMKINQFNGGINMMGQMPGMNIPMMNGMNNIGNMNGFNQIGFGSQQQIPTQQGFLPPNIMNNQANQAMSNLNNMNSNFLSSK